MATTLDETLRSKLMSAGSTLGTRVYKARAPEGAAKPYAVFRRTGGNNESHQGNETLLKSSYRIDLYDTDTTALKQLAGDVAVALDGFSGDVDGQWVKAIFLEDPSDDYEDDGSANDIGVSVVTQTYTVWSGGLY